MKFFLLNLSTSFQDEECLNSWIQCINNKRIRDLPLYENLKKYEINLSYVGSSNFTTTYDCEFTKNQVFIDDVAYFQIPSEKNHKE